ncbi:MAG: TVP38/TMEM64 family protein [Planctomycetes bacterium]|nr:TVP38/TMEM64 family protein [Planctomycetota bacterium]
MGKRSILIILGLLIVAVLVLVLHLPVGDWLERALDWVRQLGPWGPLVLTVLYVVTGVLLLPGSPLTVGVGFLYGVPLGFLIVWIGNTLGACAAFLVGRTMARGWVARRVAGSATFRAIDHAVARHGFKIVLLTRLSHIIPFNLLN